MHPLLIFLAVLAALFCAVMVWLNVEYWRMRALMTPEERKKDDEETRQELQIW